MARCAREACRRWRPDVAVRHGRLGLRVDGAWLCSPACAASMTYERLAAAVPVRHVVPSLPPLRLGALLIHQGAVGPVDLARALDAQRASGLKLGAQLIRLGLATAESVLRALAAQSGVRCLTAIDPSVVKDAPGGLSRGQVVALGVVPFRLDHQHRVIMVACAAPPPRAALAALGELTGWTPEPFLASDADLEVLTSAYGSGRRDDGTSPAFTRVRTLEDAAFRVASLATRAGAVTVKQTRWEPDTWVRIESDGRIDTLIVPCEAAAQQPGESTCQAATT